MAADTKLQFCKIKNCPSEGFENSFELSQHIAADHATPDQPLQDASDPNQPNNDLPPVLIKTVHKVELCLLGVRYKGRELQIPYHQADDARRVLKDAYGPHVLAE